MPCKSQMSVAVFYTAKYSILYAVALAIHMYPALQLMQAKNLAKLRMKILWMASKTKSRTLKITPLKNLYAYSSLFVCDEI